MRGTFYRNRRWESKEEDGVSYSLAILPIRFV